MKMNEDAASNVAPEASTASTSLGDGKEAQKSEYQPLRGLADIRTSKDLSEGSVRDILRHFTSDYSLQLVSMGKLEDMSGLNDAFNSTLCSLTCRARFDDGGEKDFHFVVKSPPVNPMMRFVHKFTLPFFNEVAWYSDLVRQLELANGKNCLQGTLPDCYHATSTYHTMEVDGELPTGCGSKCPSSCWMCVIPCRPSENGILVLENVKKRSGRSYALFDKHKPVPLGHVSLILSRLAKFHGMWMRYRFAVRSGKLPPSVAMPWDTFLRRFRTQKKVPLALYKQMKTVAKKTVIRLLTKFGDAEGNKEELISRCRRFFDVQATRTLSTYFTNPPSPECHTLCHGDFWSNNILFSYADGDEAKSDPEDLIIIDYQLINYGHPCYDLVYFLYLNTDLEFRDAHLKTLLEKYYADFSSYFDFDAEPELSNYSFQKFMDDFNWHKQIGFTTACSVVPNVLSDKELNIEGNIFTAFRELQRKQQAVLDNENDPSSIEIRRRLLGLVKEMARDEVI